MQERRVMGVRGAAGHLLWYLLLPQGSRKQGHRLRMKNGRTYGRFGGRGGGRTDVEACLS